MRSTRLPSPARSTSGATPPRSGERSPAAWSRGSVTKTRRRGARALRVNGREESERGAMSDPSRHVVIGRPPRGVASDQSRVRRLGGEGRDDVPREAWLPCNTTRGKRLGGDPCGDSPRPDHASPVCRRIEPPGSAREPEINDRRTVSACTRTPKINDRGEGPLGETKEGRGACDAGAASGEALRATLGGAPAARLPPPLCHSF